MASPSSTPLVRKLGLKAGHRLGLAAAPQDFLATLGPLPTGVTFVDGLNADAGPLDVIVFFAASQADARERFAELARRLTPAGGLWLAWPKKASGVASDMSDNVVQQIGLAAGLVDNKVCA